MDFAGKNILITGGTSALGEQLILQAIELGARVFFTWQRNEAKANELVKLGGRGLRMDLNSTEAL